jgi:hypothetical protein
MLPDVWSEAFMMAEQFNRYHIWLGIPKNEQPANHYRLLGLTPGESDPNVIGDRRMVARGNKAEWCEECDRKTSRADPGRREL